MCPGMIGQQTPSAALFRFGAWPVSETTAFWMGKMGELGKSGKMGE